MVVERRGEWVSCMIVFILATGAFISRKRFPWLSQALLISVAALLPVLGLIPFTFQEYSTVADRYTYVALLAQLPQFDPVAVWKIFFPQSDVQDLGGLGCHLVSVGVGFGAAWSERTM